MIFYVTVAELKKKSNMDKDFKKSQIALLMTICEYILNENSTFSEGQLRMMLQDAIDMVQ